MTKITLKVGNQNIEVTIDEARQIYSELDKIFGVRVEIVRDHYPYTVIHPLVIDPVFPPQYPYPYSPFYLQTGTGDFRLPLSETVCGVN